MRFLTIFTIAAALLISAQATRASHTLTQSTIRTLRGCDDHHFDPTSTRAVWTTFESTSELRIEVCSRLSSDVVQLFTARASIGRVNARFSLCENRMECVRQAMMRDDASGLFCIRRGEEFDFPLHVATDAVEVKLYDTRGDVALRLC